MSKPKPVKSKPIKTKTGNVTADSGDVLAFDGPRVVHALSDGLVPAQYYFADLECEIVMPWTFLPGAGETQYVVPVWDDHIAPPVDVLPALALDGPLTPGDFPIQFAIPQSFLLNSANVDLYFRSISIRQHHLISIRLSPHCSESTGMRLGAQGRCHRRYIRLIRSLTLTWGSRHWCPCKSLEGISGVRSVIKY